MISIIIPTYNRADFLQKTIESYLNQKYVDEILIIDDASTDSTEKVIEELKINHSAIKSLKHDTNKGLAASRIEGIINTKNDYILFGEDDVVLENDYIEKLLNCLHLHDAGIVGGRIIIVYEEEDKKDAIITWNNSKLPLIDFRYFEGNFGVKTENDVEVPFLHAIYLANKNIYKNIELKTYYKGNEYREETDLQISVLKKGYKIMFCPGAICYHVRKLEGTSGGCHSMNKISYEYYAIKNNNLFLKRHHEFLKKYGIQKIRYVMALDYAINRILYYTIYVYFGRWFITVCLKYIIDPQTILIKRPKIPRKAP